LGAKSGHLISVEDLPGAVWWEVFSGSAIDGLAHLPGRVIVPIPLLTGEGSLPGEGAFRRGVPRRWGISDW
jgi:hypothetical protein